MSVPVQVLVTQGRFRDNRRGRIEVTTDALDLARITITQPPPDPRGQGTTTELVLSGANLAGFIAQLQAAQDTGQALAPHLAVAL